MAENYLTDASFDSFMHRSGLSIIVFTAAWCAPCADIKKVLPTLQAETPDLEVAYVDIEQEPELAAAFSVQSVPFVMVVRDAVVLFADSGALPLQSLRELVAQAQALDINKIKHQES